MTEIGNKLTEVRVYINKYEPMPNLALLFQTIWLLTPDGITSKW